MSKSIRRSDGLVVDSLMALTMESLYQSSKTDSASFLIKESFFVLVLLKGLDLTLQVFDDEPFAFVLPVLLTSEDAAEAPQGRHGRSRRSQRSLEMLGTNSSYLFVDPERSSHISAVVQFLAVKLCSASSFSKLVFKLFYHSIPVFQPVLQPEDEPLLLLQQPRNLKSPG